MNYTLKRSRRKTLAISIVAGHIVVRAPLALPLSEIEAFIAKKREWIDMKVKLYQPVGADVCVRATLRVFGSEYPLKLIEASRFHIDVSDVIWVYYRKGQTADAINRAIDAHFKALLIVEIKAMIDCYAAKLNIAPPAFIVRKYRRLHGRCNHRNGLGFNTYLYHKHPDFIRYVVLHECAHILQFDHSPRFYQIIARHMPDYQGIIRQHRYY